MLLRWIILIPTFMVLALACGRQDSRMEDEIVNVRNDLQAQEARDRINRARNEENEKALAKTRKEQREISDNRFRHGVIVLAGDMVESESEQTLLEGSGVTVIAEHGSPNKHKKNLKDSKVFKKKDFSKTMSSRAEKVLAAVATGVESGDHLQAIYFGCEKHFETEVNEPTKASLLLEGDDAGAGSTNMKQTIEKINTAAGTEIISEGTIEAGDLEVSSEVWPVGSSNALVNSSILVAETVILCALPRTDNLKVAAKNLVLWNVDRTMRTSVGEWKHLIAYAENLYLQGKNQIQTFGAKNAEALGQHVQAAPHLRLEVEKIHRPTEAAKILNSSEIDFSGELNILARGANANE